MEPVGSEEQRESLELLPESVLLALRCRARSDCRARSGGEASGDSGVICADDCGSGRGCRDGEDSPRSARVAKKPCPELASVGPRPPLPEARDAGITGERGGEGREGDGGGDGLADGEESVSRRASGGEMRGEASNDAERCRRKTRAGGLTEASVGGKGETATLSWLTSSGEGRRGTRGPKALRTGGWMGSTPDCQRTGALGSGMNMRSGRSAVGWCVPGSGRAGRRGRSSNRKSKPPS